MRRVFPIIKTKWLLLRQFEKSDLEKVFKRLSHPHVIKYYGVSYDRLEATKAQLNCLPILKRKVQEYDGQFVQLIIKYSTVAED